MVFIPIYGYYAEKPCYRYQYSSNPNVGHGWLKGGIAFYAYENQQPDTSPIYGYYAEKPYYRYQYSSNPNVGHGWTKGGIAFYAVSVEIQWKYLYDCIEYEEVQRPPTKKDLIDKRIVRNASKLAEFEQTVVLSKTTTSTFEWGLTQNLSATTTLGFEADLPFGSASGEFSLQLDLGSHQTWSKSEAVELKVEQKVTVPPGESVVVSGFADIANNVVTSFTLSIRVSATRGGMVLSGEQISKIFSQLNPDATIKTVDSAKIIASLKGVFSGSYALDTFTSIDPYDDKPT